MLRVVFSSLKQDCKAGIKVSLSEDGQHLVVSEMNEDHNHNITQVDNSFTFYGINFDVCIMYRLFMSIFLGNES